MYSLDVLLFLFGTSLLFHVQFFYTLHYFLSFILHKYFVGDISINCSFYLIFFYQLVSSSGEQKSLRVYQTERDMV